MNDRTDENTRFFAVEIQTVKIGDSQPAPDFKLVAQPNDWAKQVRATTGVGTGEVSARQQLYWDFWDRFRTRVLADHSDWTWSTQSTRSSWFGMAAGTSGVNWLSTFTRNGLGVQLVFEAPDPELNSARFEAPMEKRDVMEAAFGAPLQWEPLEGYKSCRVATYVDGYCDVAETERWDEWVDWLIKSGEKMRAALKAADGIPNM